MRLSSEASAVGGEVRGSKRSQVSLGEETHRMGQARINEFS